MRRLPKDATISVMDKTELVGQLVRQFETSARAALSARDAVVLEAKEGATPDEKREDARAAHQAQSMGRAQQKRAQDAMAAVVRRDVPARQAAGDAKIGIGALVEIGTPTTGKAARSSSAVGAGMTLHGPGCDGDFVVVTPTRRSAGRDRESERRHHRCHRRGEVREGDHVLG